MDKSHTRKRRGRKTQTSRLRWVLILLSGLGLLLLGGGLWWTTGRTSSSPPADLTPQAETARLAVDRDSIDLGVQPLNRLASAVFNIRNVGKTPLQVLGLPEVELVKGC
jgi:hypothetical protein